MVFAQAYTFLVVAGPVNLCPCPTVRVDRLQVDMLQDSWLPAHDVCLMALLMTLC